MSRRSIEPYPPLPPRDGALGGGGAGVVVGDNVLTRPSLYLPDPRDRNRTRGRLGSSSVVT